MKSTLLFFVLLAIPGCLAYIKLKPKGYYDQCPYKNETLLQRVTLHNLEGYITENNWATFACIKEIEEDYVEAIDIFVKNMGEVTEKFKEKSLTEKELQRNYPYFVSKTLQDMGIDIQKYVKLLTGVSQEGNSNDVKHYDKILKDIVDRDYKLYEKNLDYLENRVPCESDIIEAKNKIHDGCSPGMKILEGVGKYFKTCMTKRLSESKV